MTTIVKHRKTGNEYILLGITGETGKANPSRFISELFSQDKSEVSSSATVCDFQGNIFLAYIDDLMVMEIDGKKPADLLTEPVYETAERDVYDSESSDFEDFEDEELEEELNEEQDTTSTDTEPPKPFIYGQSSTDRSKVDDDEEDWI